MDVGKYTPHKRQGGIAAISSTSAEAYADLDAEEAVVLEDDLAGIEMQTRAPRHSFAHMQMVDTPSRRLTGANASRHYASKRVERDQALEKQRQQQNTPKAIEAMLKAARTRPRRRGPLSRLPNPVAKARRFLADPVTRFLLGCNVCAVLTLFGGSALFMIYVYPIVLRPTLKY